MLNRSVNFSCYVTPYRSHSDPLAVFQTKYGLKGTNLPSTLTSMVRNISLLSTSCARDFYNVSNSGGNLTVCKLRIQFPQTTF